MATSSQEWPKVWDRGHKRRDSHVEHCCAADGWRLVHVQHFFDFHYLYINKLLVEKSLIWEPPTILVVSTSRRILPTVQSLWVLHHWDTSTDEVHSRRGFNKIHILEKTQSNSLISGNSTGSIFDTSQPQNNPVPEAWSTVWCGHSHKQLEIRWPSTRSRCVPGERLRSSEKLRMPRDDNKGVIWSFGPDRC